MLKKTDTPLKLLITSCYLVCLFLMLSVISSGFEPETHSLEGCCSIQLSYETNLFFFLSLLRLFCTKRLQR